MAASTAQRRTYLGGDARRAEILRFAGELFCERSYDAVSIADVARAAGVARGLVNHYFGTKRGLFLEVVRAMLFVPDELLVAERTDGQLREEVRAMRSTGGYTPLSATAAPTWPLPVDRASAVIPTSRQCSRKPPIESPSG